VRRQWLNYAHDPENRHITRLWIDGANSQTANKLALLKPDSPEVGTLREVRPSAPRTVPCFKLIAQRLGIMIHHQLKTALRIKLFK
jgi:hypothetical protein